MSADEELQNKIEKGFLDEESLDARSYAKVFEVLRQEPFQLPPNFADQVVIRLGSRSSLLKDYGWLGLGLLSFLVAARVTLAFTHFSFGFGVFKFLAEHSMLLAFGLAFILLVHVIDQFLIRRTRLPEQGGYH